MKTIGIHATPLSHRPFLGIGVQADCFIYDDQNRKAGVTEADLEMYRQRLAALRPGIVRIFLGLDDFNPSFDGKTYDWKHERFQRQLFNLKFLKSIGSRVNVCIAPWSNDRMRRDEMETCAVDLIEHLVREEGLDHIGWLSLFNEPDKLYSHDSPLYRRLFPKDEAGRRPWSDYVAMHRRAQALLEARGLHPSIKLVVADTVYGYAMRQERIRMAAADFADLDVAYSSHNYIVDWPGFYEGSPDFYSPGMVEEARTLRTLAGPDAEFAIWEFNNAGAGFGTGWPGMGRHGEDLLGSLDNGVAVSRKIIEALTHGVDGIAVWCLCDMYYNSAAERGLMQFGLWQFRDRKWEPRPYYYYVGALMNALCPGMVLHGLDDLPEGILGLASVGKDECVTVLLNTGRAPQHIQLSMPSEGVKRLRVYPDRLPTADRLPCADWETLSVSPQDGAVELLPRELTVFAHG